MEDWRKIKASDWSTLNPDSAMHSFGESKGYTAFVWLLDKSTNKSILFCQPANEYHQDGFESSASALQGSKAYRGKPNIVALVGRFGEAKRERSRLVKNPENHPEGGSLSNHPEGGFVTLWTVAKDQAGETYGFNNANMEETKTFLMALLGKFPMDVKGNSPAKLPITESYVVRTDYPQISQTVGQFLAGAEEEEDPVCSKMAIDVHGKPTPIGAVVGQMHMVRGQQLDLLKGAFCSQYSLLRNSPNTVHCKTQNQQLDDIAANFKCGLGEFEAYKKAGKFARRQDLKNLFSNPQKLGQEFRTQKELDAAWDELQDKKEHILDFRQYAKRR